MATYTQILYHIVFGTKDHQGTLDLEHHDEVCRYIAGILKNKDCFIYNIGGYTDHLHLLIRLHPSLALANLIKDLKRATSKWVKTKKLLPAFSGWQDGYGAFTCTWKDKQRISNYIAHQRWHHQVKTFQQEYTEMLQKAGIEYDERFLCR